MAFQDRRFFILTRVPAPTRLRTLSESVKVSMTEKPHRILVYELLKRTGKRRRLCILALLDVIEENTGTRPESIGLLSSEYHLFRAGLFAQRLGLEALGVPARTTLPVLKVNVTMKFTPPEVTKAVYQCWDELTTTTEAGQATVCLTIHKSSQDRLGELPPGRPDPYLPEAPLPSTILRAEWSQEPRSHLHIRPTALLPPSSHAQAFRFLLQDTSEVCPLFHLAREQGFSIQPTLSCVHGYSCSLPPTLHWV